MKAKSTIVCCLAKSDRKLDRLGWRDAHDVFEEIGGVDLGKPLHVNDCAARTDYSFIQYSGEAVLIE